MEANRYGAIRPVAPYSLASRNLPDAADQGGPRIELVAL
jgi:hypothetical protein